MKQMFLRNAVDFAMNFAVDFAMNFAVIFCKKYSDIFFVTAMNAFHTKIRRVSYKNSPKNLDRGMYVLRSFKTHFFDQNLRKV